MVKETSIMFANPIGIVLTDTNLKVTNAISVSIY